ncbi:LOW QUALITY PROTEIN: hypothetical protein PHMEG_00012263 [Phytophthora megakarya]|uniref:ZSWIM1/3 RNaseH-like domain-containing protein n=1 Tax=Phytophthora megakarya TaxID=4795 RepID=A0A225W973_9STRA|nr:LOW QUALITY PROTEIN: hypothetical protein PHMEG_00012263 [Phytophthora megakarya]
MAAMQNRMNVTCGIIIQTEHRTLIIEQASNVCNRHLATPATGRGFPVLYLLCMNEQATMIASILKFFKEKNPSSRRLVRSAVIDIDFVEWHGLKSVSGCRSTTVSISHDLLLGKVDITIDFWSEAYSTRIVDCKASCSTLGTANKTGTHVGGCGKFCPRCIFHSWKYQNQPLESNWNQTNLLLGRKTRNGRTFVGLLQRQVLVTQQILRNISRTVTGVFKKIKADWERRYELRYMHSEAEYKFKMGGALLF